MKKEETNGRKKREKGKFKRKGKGKGRKLIAVENPYRIRSSVECNQVKNFIIKKGIFIFFILSVCVCVCLFQPRFKNWGHKSFVC